MITQPTTPAFWVRRKLVAIRGEAASRCLARWARLDPDCRKDVPTELAERVGDSPLHGHDVPNMGPLMRRLTRDELMGQ